jgi:hypothetical protein
VVRPHRHSNHNQPNKSFAWLVPFPFYVNIDSATFFEPKCGHSLVKWHAAGGIARDDEAIASINTD